MKRIVVLLTVVALMMVILVGGATSAAFSSPTIVSGCTVRGQFFLVTGLDPQSDLAQQYDRNGDGTICEYRQQNGAHQESLHFTDNNH
jgi:hypothetical protein